MRAVPAIALALVVLLMARPILAHDADEPFATLETLPVVGGHTPHCPAFQDDAGTGSDAGDTRDRGIEIAEDGTYSGCGDATDRRDWYTIPTQAGDRVRVTVTELDCSRIRLDLHMQGKSLNSYYGASDRAACGPEVVGFAGVDEDRNYQLLAGTRPDDGGGHYMLTVERGPDLVGACGDPQDDGGSGKDASEENVVALPGTGSTTGCVDEFDGYDWFKVEADAGDRVQAVITAETCGAYDMLMGGPDASVDDDHSRDVDRCAPYAASVAVFADSSVFIGFLSLAHGTSYALDVTVVAGGA